MSAAGRGAARRARDAYFTPPELARAICARLQGLLPAPVTALEPSAGAGAFVDAAKTAWPDALVMGTDIEPQRHDIRRCNFLTDQTGTWDLILGNPPFLRAEAFLRKALDLVSDGGHVAFLLRTCFLHGQKRARWVLHDLRWLLPFAERPSFTDDGRTDAADYSLFVWRKKHDWPPMILPPLYWRAHREPADDLPLFAGGAK